MVDNVQLFLLVLFRTLAMFEVAPLFSSTSIPQSAKIGFAFFSAAVVFPIVLSSGYPIPSNAVDYFLLALGEVAIGLVIGFMLQLLYAAFQTAGDFFSLQMGFGASMVFDPLAQEEIPLMGEFLNLIALLVFISVSGAGKFVMLGISGSFASIKAVDFVVHYDAITKTLVQGLSGMFQTALTISFPILGTLTLISITTGLLSKAAPQMDILTMGFPISIGVTFIVIIATLPFMLGTFERVIDAIFRFMAQTMAGIGGVNP
jgi:flagellar biosynthetic protein FliR